MSVTDGPVPPSPARRLDGATQRATFTPTAALAPTTAYTATVSGAKDLSGITMANTSSSCATAAADTTPPTVTARTPADGATGVPTNTTVTATFSETVTGSSVAVSVPTGSAVAGTSSYNATTRTVTFTPSVALAAGTQYSVAVSAATDGSGNVMVPVTWSFTTATSGLPVHHLARHRDARHRGGPRYRSGRARRKFRLTAGFVTGIRFYKGTANTGTHIGSLWSSTGTKLGSVTFTGETATGWQQATFATPLPVTAGTTYVASYYAPNGRYAVNEQYFTTATTNGPLTALQRR